MSDRVNQLIVRNFLKGIVQHLINFTTLSNSNTILRLDIEKLNIIEYVS